MHRSAVLRAGSPRQGAKVRQAAQRKIDLARCAFAAVSAAEWIVRLDGAGIPAGKVRRIDETYEWDQTRSQGLVVEVDHATLGRISLPGPPVRFDGGDRRTHAAPPTLGQHDESVRAWLNEVDAKEDGNGG